MGVRAPVQPGHGPSPPAGIHIETEQVIEKIVAGAIAVNIARTYDRFSAPGGTGNLLSVCS